MKKLSLLLFVFSLLASWHCSPGNSTAQENATSDKKTDIHPDLAPNAGILINKKADGYQGIWYMNQPLDNEYKYKYSGGMGTYCAKHKSFAVYRPEVNKTFFCYGGTDGENSTLFHMVSYFDHATGEVPKPTLLLDKRTIDAHDNPVISMDDDGYIYIFSTSHGTARPSYIHKSKKPYDIEEFVPLSPTKQEDGQPVPMENFSYMQTWHVPSSGFLNFFTRYKYPADRTICFMSSKDGETWSEWQRIAAIKKGHYQSSAVGKAVAGTMFNFHPDTKEKNGLNWRTNLYYVETRDNGKTWQTADGTPLKLPLTEIENPALIHDYYNEDLNVYLKDIIYDKDDRPVLLYITSKGFESGPQNNPRTWRTARWTGSEWEIRDVTTSDNNYDMGSLYIEEDGSWKIIGPTETGPQPFNPGGEMAMWESKNKGESWKMVKQLTKDSPYNHTYARRPVNAHPDVYAFWADGHGRQPSESRLYFCNKDGEVFMLPQKMAGERFELIQ